jgi:peptidyl-lysine (3S)-dioxygenase / protease
MHSFDGVPYLSHQNSSLTGEFPTLAAEVPQTLSFAREAFGNDAEAVNLWIGDERAVSACHKVITVKAYCFVIGSPAAFPPCCICVPSKLVQKLSC